MKRKTAKRLNVIVSVFSACAITLNMSNLVALPKEKFKLEAPYKVSRIKNDNNKLSLKKR